MAELVVMFDYDGVLADSFDIFFEEFTAACQEMGFKRLNSKEAFLRLFEGNLIQQLIKAGFPVWKLKKLARAFEPRIMAANRRVPPFPGMPELLAEVADAFPVYVITSNATVTITEFLERYSISGVRDVLGADKETSKVKKIRQVREQVPCAQPYYIGDTKGDMLEGRKAGATTVAALWGWHPEETLLEGNPDHLVRNPQELRALFL
jgi:phosphoglycolate phosphatase